MRLGNGIATGQRGSVLIISLIILLVLTMLGIAAIRLGITNLLATNNMQARQEAQAAAEEVINKQVLSINFLNENMNATLEALKNTNYSYSAGSKAYKVKLTKPCLRSVAKIPPEDPLLNDAAYVAVAPGAKSYKYCLTEVTETGKMESNCYRALWEVRATVTSGFLGVNTDVTQGFSMVMGLQKSVDVTNLDFYCAVM